MLSELEGIDFGDREWLLAVADEAIECLFFVPPELQARQQNQEESAPK